ncbi:hypothetical protein B1H58_15075 [Pantoea alhagi]|uniref:Alanyl-transfer RNA synthetases family profile domain-containing protein n=1 Tax=Pantoea alhagi TaxID=1891675 RepID=A0A1W6B804_9GAMM|nr:hypothetical protein [Pantoea alhagi]ARJ43220.1 hypothetical protein B1H58_15075 [Pantoea alhagi]
MTDLLYRTEPAATRCEAQLIAWGTDEKGAWLATDRTPFYPQGGGQMSDRGTLTLGGQSYDSPLALMRDGSVRHYIAALPGALRAGEPVTLAIDAEFRLLASRSHSAGHLISHVVETMQPDLIPDKGHHFLPGAYVELQGELHQDAQTFLQQAQQQINAALAAALPIAITESNFNDIATLRPELAEKIPQQPQLRIVTIGNYRPFACGGTHVPHSGAIGELTLRKIKVKNGVRISYELLPG